MLAFIKSHLKLACVLTGFIGGFFYTSPVTAGKIYKWVDENGITQFSTYPPLVQKKNQPVTTVKGLTTSPSTTGVTAEDLQYVWFIIENRTKNTLTFSKDVFTYRPQTSKTSMGLTSAGKWKLDGGVLELTYTQHKDKSKKDSKERFYIKMQDEYSLTLISENGNKRLSFRRDTDLLKSDKAISRLAQNMMGFWQGVGDSDSINFSNETFEITGKRKEKVSINTYERVGTKYRGRWSVDDPYINLEVTLDEVYKLENWVSEVGQQWRWLIVKKSPEMLTVRDTKTRRLKKFIKTTN